MDLIFVANAAAYLVVDKSHHPLSRDLACALINFCARAHEWHNRAEHASICMCAWRENPNILWKLTMQGKLLSGTEDVGVVTH